MAAIPPGLEALVLALEWRHPDADRGRARRQRAHRPRAPAMARGAVDRVVRMSACPASSRMTSIGVPALARCVQNAWGRSAAPWISASNHLKVCILKEEGAFVDALRLT